VAGTDLYTHIKAMMITTIPSIVVALVVFAVMGLNAEPEGAIEVTVGRL
jgi:Na+:H+ antiporter, NhaC family